jgi:Lon protease-like protein
MSVRIPLFPLNVVLFPGGILSLKIFEKRYVDMVRSCLRDNQGFGIVLAQPDQRDAKLPFASLGVLVEIVETNVPQPGLFDIRCLAKQKMMVQTVGQQSDLLWLGDVELLLDEADHAIPEDLIATKVYFEQLIQGLKNEIQNEASMPFQKPYNLDSCDWLANRWCEILNIPLEQKQSMLAIGSPLLRLQMINDILTNTEDKI